MHRRITKVSYFHIPLGTLLQAGSGIILYLGIFLPPVAAVMTVSGPITASSVTVSGSVTMSSMTVSSITVTNLLNVTGTTSGISGRVLQMAYSSSTVITTANTTSWTAVSNIVQSMALSKANDYVHISLSGNIFSDADGLPGYITIFRDSTNLGDTNSGMATAGFIAAGGSLATNPVGIVLTDSPGDTSTHTYQVYIRSSAAGVNAYFPYNTVGYLLLEETTN